ncbi:hypothetical protein [Lysobacter gummosus]
MSAPGEDSCALADVRHPAFRVQPASLGYSEPSPCEEEVRMSADTKTPLDHVNATLNQLKEMRHYSKNYVEQLTAQWLLFDGELSKLKQAERIEELMTRQGELYDALDAEIAELEEVAVSLQPVSDEAAGTVH